MDVDGNGTIDIPTEVSDGGSVSEELVNKLHFLLWKDYATPEGATTSSAYTTANTAFPAAAGIHARQCGLKSNANDTGWELSNLAGDIVYCEMRVVDSSQADLLNDRYSRVATIGSQQLQARIVTEYYGLKLEDILSGVTILP